MIGLLFTRQTSKRDYDDKILSSIEGLSKEFRAKFKGSKEYKNLFDKTPDIFKLKIGARVMFNRNIFVHNKYLVNEW